MSTTLPRPIAVSDHQLSQIMAAAAVLAPSDRDRFLRALADALRNEPGELGDGVLGRAIKHVIKPYFRPPTIGEQPRHNSKVGEPIP
jgi:hypothetical protein